MKVAIVGCGVIGTILARFFIQKHSVTLCDRTFAKSETLAKELGATAFPRLQQATEAVDVIFLCVKPKDLQQIAKELVLQPHQIMISVLAGTSISLLQTYFPKVAIIRAMPNLAISCGEGVIGFTAASNLPEMTKERISSLCQGLGLLMWLSEDKLEALSAIAGSGPAFVFVLIEAMIDSAVLLGFTQTEARELVLKTLEGSTKLLRVTASHPAELKGKVASPGGTTITGLKTMEKGGIRGVLMQTFQDTFLKAKELQK